MNVFLKTLAVLIVLYMLMLLFKNDTMTDIYLPTEPVVATEEVVTTTPPATDTEVTVTEEAKCPCTMYKKGRFWKGYHMKGKNFGEVVIYQLFFLLFLGFAAFAVRFGWEAGKR